MIDWWGLFSNAVWVFALAILLATFSYQRYRTHRYPELPKTAWVDFWYRLGTLLFVVGQLLISTSHLEQAVWSILAILLIAEPIVMRWRHQQPATDTPQQEEEEYRG